MAQLNRKVEAVERAKRVVELEVQEAKSKGGGALVGLIR